MQRLIAGILILPLIALITGLAGCGKEDTPKPVPRKPLAVNADGNKVVPAKPTIKPGTAKVVGKVVLVGDVPKLPSLEARMLDHKSDGKFCLSGPEAEKADQTWLIKDRGVANAVIWLSPPADKDFEVVNTPGEVVLDQPHCVYIPHVLALKPGQKLFIKNSANVVHNTQLKVDPFANPRTFENAIPSGKSAVVDFLNPQDDVINIGCQFHLWMGAKLWVKEHQYVAVTKADGSFTIDNVPEGVELSVVAWHEGASPNYFYGAGKKGQKQTFKAGENKLGDIPVKAP